jgi:putative DNA primase/helicase
MQKPFGTKAHSAEVLKHLLREQVLHVPEWGWMVWDGKRWKQDIEGIRAWVLAHRALYKYYASCAEQAVTPQEQAKAHKAAERACSTCYVERVLKQLKEMVLASPDEFNAHPHLLNCSNCVVDLRDGSTMPHAPELRLTKLCPTNYNPKARSELWERFLEDVFLGDRELIAYMQRALGYSITGETREQKIFICYGTGANGKSALFNIVRGVVGSDYVEPVSMRALRRDRRSHDAMRNAMYERTLLCGVRLATLLLETLSEEKQLGRVLPKLFATGDTITARYAYQKPFVFTLQAKLWLATNYKPRITDRAMLRSVVIPFRAVFSRDPKIDPAVRRDPDPDIEDKLLAPEHREAILAWLVEGAKAWYERS